MKTLFAPWFRILIALALVMALLPSGGAFAAKNPPPPTLVNLQPGGFRNIDQALDINVVFIGYEPGAGARDIDQAGFLAQLPPEYRTVLRIPGFYGLDSQMGLNFTYNYHVQYAPPAFEDLFFGYLSSIAVAKPLTQYQDQYNTQAARSLDVTSNYWIDAPSVEHWLHHNGHHELGVDPEQYTVYFINWFDRPDFKFHVYTKTNEPDPDTGYNFGVLRESRKLIAWGGTPANDEENGHAGGDMDAHPHRLWFYDLSAGPEAWTDNWNLEDADVDGNGVLDYRMPPVWEYGSAAAYRPFDDLSGDLGKVTRYVALNLLFTASPLYKPAISPPALPSDIQLDINVFQMDPASDGTQYFIPSLIVSELGKLQPLNTFSVEMNSQAFGSPFERIYGCFYNGVSCFGSRLFGIPFAGLFLYFNDTLMQYLEGDGDYEVPVFAFNATDDLFTCCLGFADDNWADGTQSFVFAFDSPSIRDVSGYGFTTTIIHEVGHHLGLSHPHDGYDYASNVDYNPADDFFFAWSGDESNSMMSYIDLNWDFSQFDQDNMNRYLVSSYINQSNAILANIYATSKAGQVSSLLTAADALVGQALSAYAALDYVGAARYARQAYDNVLAAAAALNVPVEPQSWQADYKAKGASSKFVDSVDYQRSKP